MPLENPIPLRLSSDEQKTLKKLSAKVKVNRSSILRLAVMMGLPLVEKNFSAPASTSAPAPRKRGGAK